MKCSLRKRTWVPMGRGSKRERCTTCGTKFPCTHACEHFDCILATGRTLPDWVTLVERATVQP